MNLPDPFATRRFPPCRGNGFRGTVRRVNGGVAKPLIGAADGTGTKVRWSETSSVANSGPVSSLIEPPAPWLTSGVPAAHAREAHVV